MKYLISYKNVYFIHIHRTIEKTNTHLSEFNEAKDFYNSLETLATRTLASRSLRVSFPDWDVPH